MGTETVLDRGVGTAIEEWWRSGETMTYNGHTVNDYYPAFNRALENYDATVSSAATRARGFTLLFGPGDYHFSNTPTLIRGMYLLGQGGHGQSAHGTVFRYADHVDGLHARFADTSTTEPLSPGGGRGRSEYSVIENITIVGNYRRSLDDHGIWALAPIRISNCLIVGWGGNGIRMTSAPEGERWTSSTNHSVIEHCTVQECGWHGVNRSDPDSWRPSSNDPNFYRDGIYVYGSNSNGILFSAVHCRSNGRWGFYDESGTESTYVACMTHDNGIARNHVGVAENLPFGGCYKVGDADARSVFIGCYAESDQRPAEVSAPTLIFGGAMAVNPARGQYFRTDLSSVLHLETGVSVWNRREGSEWVKGTLGKTRDWAGVVFEAVNERHPTDARPGITGLPLNLRYDERAKTWEWRHDARKYMVIGTKGDSNQLGIEGGVGRGQVLFPQGLLLGQETGNKPQIQFKYEGRGGGAAGNIQGITKTQQVRIVEGSEVSHVEKPFFEGYASVPPNGGTWNRGDRLWKLNPSPGDIMGWVCTQSGTPGTWKRFGTIEP